ncbi:unnamed protein product [Mytilus edulis]|uniref:DDE Tnp4 domain-containing protein n=1 Tax=Mytilus edulis TaxID=6550 RepID=A0A8S3PQD0_MYTED|nr:unnamed protein product [Mytilus edulis]
MNARQPPVDVNCRDKNQRVEKENVYWKKAVVPRRVLTLVRLKGDRLVLNCFLAEKLKDLVAWLPRETIRACCPESFRENYPRTTVIIDCAETFIQRPTNLKTRSETFSNYKSHNTAKYLVGISPHGQIMFISKAFGGRASDKFIVEKSGFLNYLLPGDEVMADRGFTIEDFLFLVV